MGVISAGVTGSFFFHFSIAERFLHKIYQREKYYSQMSTWEIIKVEQLTFFGAVCRKYNCVQNDGGIFYSNKICFCNGMKLLFTIFWYIVKYNANDFSKFIMRVTFIVPLQTSQKGRKCLLSEYSSKQNM